MSVQAVFGVAAAHSHERISHEATYSPRSSRYGGSHHANGSKDDRTTEEASGIAYIDEEVTPGSTGGGGKEEHKERGSLGELEHSFLSLEKQ